jgi:hypothetical protein
MGSLEAMGKVHVHIDAGHGVLKPFRLIQDGDRVAYIFHPDFVDLNFSMIHLILNVIHGHLPK